MRVLIMLLGFFVFLETSGQNTMLSSKDSDPNAKVILDKMKKLYDSYKTIEVNFEMELELPGQTNELQKGLFIQDGNKYQIKMKDHEVYSDGKSVWIYVKKNKEVQLTDIDNSDSDKFLSPKQMMRVYESGKYVYKIIEERKVNGQLFTDIEFKPLDKKAEYSKMRLTVDKKSNKMVSLRVFSKDGSKYTLKINDLISNKKYDSAIFAFNTKAYPGIHIEDLRMD